MRKMHKLKFTYINISIIKSIQDGENMETLAIAHFIS